MCQDCSSASTFWPKSVASVASRMLISAMRLRALGVELGAGAHEARVGPLQHARLLGVEIEIIAPLVKVGDAGEELAVEIAARSDAARASA